MAMTASMTRSRRAEGLRHPHSPIQVSHHHPKIITAAFSPNANTNRTNKRQFEQSTRDIDPIISKKRRFTTNIAVEIPAPPRARDSQDARPKPVPAPVKQVKPPKPATASTATTADSNPPPNPSRGTHITATTTQAVPPANNRKPSLTKHQEKVVNGLKHELNRLQPALPPDIQTQGRKLRSQEASRFKSELSTYFPEYDEVIGNEPKEQHLINIDTPIIIVPGSDAALHYNQDIAVDGLGNPQPPRPDKPYIIRGYADALFTDLFDAQRIDFKFLESQSHKGKSSKDPLPDSVFQPCHKKEERAERSARNLERGRAQHEKEQIIRLLDGLQGHDWLRVMGVSGITESKKKKFEPAREHFINGCQAILDKFRLWAAEEKRRKLQKDQWIAEAEARAARQQEAEEAQEEDEDPEEEDEAEEVEQVSDDEEVADSEEEMVDDNDEDGDSDGDPPDYDVDASIAKQLRDEVIAAAKKTSSKRARLAQSSPRPLSTGDTEFKSFFQKPYERAAALNKNRRRGRTVKAWGQSMPDVKESEYQLPQEFLDKDLITSLERTRRIRKRRKN